MRSGLEIGGRGGRPKALIGHQLKTAVRMLAAPDVNVQGVAEHFGGTRSTLYRFLSTSQDKTGAKDRGG